MLHKEIAWKFWYTTKDSGEYLIHSYSNLDGPPELGPVLGVQVLVLPHISVGRQLAFGHDYYWYEFDIAQWMSGNMDGYKQYMYTPGLKAVKYGTVIDTSVFDEVIRRAANDDELPPKSAYHRHERQHYIINEVMGL